MTAAIAVFPLQYSHQLLNHLFIRIGFLQRYQGSQRSKRRTREKDAGWDAHGAEGVRIKDFPWYSHTVAYLG